MVTHLNLTGMNDSYEAFLLHYYNREKDVVYYCHKGRRTEEQWRRAKQIMREYCPEAAIIGVTYHRGTQRSYIFILHPEKKQRYSGLLKNFPNTTWNVCFAKEPIVSDAI